MNNDEKFDKMMGVFNHSCERIMRGLPKDSIDKMMSICKKLSKRIPQDCVVFDNGFQTAHKFISLYDNSCTINFKAFNKASLNIGSLFIPGDLIKQNTIPLKELKIQYNFSNSTDFIYVYIVDKTDWINIDENTTQVGYIVQDCSDSPYFDFDKESAKEFKDLKLIWPILIINTEDGIALQFSPAHIAGQDSIMYTDYSRDVFENCIQDNMFYLKTWYGVQIALLHPELKTIFSKHKSRSIIQNKSHNSSKKKRKVKYQKIMRIEDNDYDEVVNKRTINRKCLLWYVIGHYRERNGKKYWVDGFWKGALRATKMITDIHDQRDREVVTAI